MCMLEPPLAGHAETPIRFPVPETKLKRDLFADVSLNGYANADTP
jgi:hypothetical protein